MAKPERLENHLVFLFLTCKQINVANIFTYSTEQIVPIMHILKKMTISEYSRQEDIVEREEDNSQSNE